MRSNPGSRYIRKRLAPSRAEFCAVAGPNGELPGRRRKDAKVCVARGSHRAGRTGDQCGNRAGILNAYAVVLPGGDAGSDSESCVADANPGCRCTTDSRSRGRSAADDSCSRRPQPARRASGCNRSVANGSGSEHSALSADAIVCSSGRTDSVHRSTGCVGGAHTVCRNDSGLHSSAA